MRLFLALNPPADVRHRIWDATAALRVVAPDVSWAPEERIHTTLKFLGERPEQDVSALTQSLVAVCNSHKPFGVSVKEAGAFPNFRRPRIVWIGVDPEPRLELLHHDVERVCAALGHELDGRPFRPHLTLGRVRTGVPADQVRALRAAAKKVAFADDFTVQSIDLMQSAPGASGSTYRVIAAAKLGAG